MAMESPGVPIEPGPMSNGRGRHILSERWERIPDDPADEPSEWAWLPLDRRLAIVTLSGRPTKNTTKMATPGKDKSARMDSYSDSDPAEEG